MSQMMCHEGRLLALRLNCSYPQVSQKRANLGTRLEWATRQFFVDCHLFLSIIEELTLTQKSEHPLLNWSSYGREEFAILEPANFKKSPLDSSGNLQISQEVFVTRERKRGHNHFRDSQSMTESEAPCG